MEILKLKEGKKYLEILKSKRKGKKGLEITGNIKIEKKRVGKKNYKQLEILNSKIRKCMKITVIVFFFFKSSSY